MEEYFIGLFGIAGKNICISIIIFLFGICIGSFLNVVIFRYGTSESPNKGRSHCMSCNKLISWYDNIPIISFIILGGKCRNCKAKISLQYPIVEFINAFLWVLLFLVYGFKIKTIVYMITTSILLVLAFIDEKTFTIPTKGLLGLLALGILNLIFEIFNTGNYVELILGALCCGGFLLIFFILTKGMGLGFGDVILMFNIGLIEGIKEGFIGFIIGGIFAIVIHSLRMKISHKDRKLAFGPYLAIGAIFGMFFGSYLIELYIKLLGEII